MAFESVVERDRGGRCRQLGGQAAAQDVPFAGVAVLVSPATVTGP